MRLDVNDPNHWSEKYLGTKVFLDGKEVKLADAFDDMEGWVNAAKLDSETGYAMIKPNTDEVWTERLYGKVTYQLPPAAK